MKTENVRKQLKKSQNIFKIVWCIGNANIDIKSIFPVSTYIFFSVTPKTNINYIENLRVKVACSGVLKNTIYGLETEDRSENFYK